MRHTEVWSRLEAALGSTYYRVWAGEFVITELDHRTVVEALDGGVAPQQVWAAAWKALELPASER